MAIMVNNIQNLDQETLEYFGLKSTGVFASPKTRKVLDTLESAVLGNKMIYLNAASGYGKTTLVRQLKDRLSLKVKFIHVRNLSDRKILMSGILEAIITDLSNARPRMSIEARSRQTVRILGNNVVSNNTPVCLLIDNTPDRLAGDTINALKLLREEDFGGHTPLLSTIVTVWPEFYDRIHKRKDLVQRGFWLNLNEQNGWFTFEERVKYLEDVFMGAITANTRKRIAAMFLTPEDMNFYVANMMKKAKSAGFKIIDEHVVEPSLKEIYHHLKESYSDKISLAIIGKQADVTKGTVSLVLSDEPDTPSTAKVKKALYELMDILSGNQEKSTEESKKQQKLAS
ncbi:MAG: ATP-binding protein [Balneolaceae bacterium]